MAAPVAMLDKELVNAAFETSLDSGIHSVFALADQKEGMAAFIDKHKPVFKNC